MVRNAPRSHRKLRTSNQHDKIYQPYSSIHSSPEQINNDTSSNSFTDFSDSVSSASQTSGPDAKIRKRSRKEYKKDNTKIHLHREYRVDSSCRKLLSKIRSVSIHEIYRMQWCNHCANES